MTDPHDDPDGRATPGVAVPAVPEDVEPDDAAQPDAPTGAGWDERNGPPDDPDQEGAPW